MNILLAQIIVAARRGNDKDTGWMQLLIVVVAAAIYGLVGILKTKANKLERKRQEQPGRKRAPEPSEGTLATKRLPTRPDEQARRPSQERERDGSVFRPKYAWKYNAAPRCAWRAPRLRQ